MARPREFDREVALRTAMRVFWTKGYEATTTDDLRHAIGIGRQSLYDTFGGKHALYLEALRLYQTESVNARVGCLRDADTPLSAISDLLVGVARETPALRGLGCMGVNAMCEFGVSDPEVSAMGNTSAAILVSALERTIKEGKAKGQIRASVDERDAAQFIQATLVALKVTAKAGAKPAQLQRIAQVAIDGLKAA